MIQVQKRWQIKETAISLRKKGLSYNEIKEFIPVSKSTLSHWLRDITLTDEQINKLKSKYDTQFKGANAVKIKRQKEIQIIKEAAIKEIKPLSKEQFKIAGLMLYWAEGNKTHKVGVTNSDPELVLFMIKWFRQVFKVSNSKFKAHLHLHSGQNEEAAKIFWSSLLDIPISQFGKSHIKKEGTGHRKRILYNGTIKVDIFNKDLLYKILFMKEEVAKQITGR